MIWDYGGGAALVDGINPSLLGGRREVYTSLNLVSRTSYLTPVAVSSLSS